MGEYWKINTEIIGLQIRVVLYADCSCMKIFINSVCYLYNMHCTVFNSQRWKQTKTQHCHCVGW